MSHLNTSTAEALKNEGNARRAAGDLQGAIDSYRRALAAEPDYVAALYNLGLALRDVEELDEAEACFRRVVDIEPADVEALFNLAALLRHRLSFAEAEQVYRRALGLSPDNAHLWLMLGEIGLARSTGESLRDAQECFRKAAELRPDLADAHHGLGNACMAAGHPAAAAQAYRETLRLDPQNAVLMLDLANALRPLGQRAEAMSLIARALEIEPSLPEAQNLLGMLLQDERRLDEALEHYRKAVALAPNDAASHNNVACVLGLQGQLDQAIASLRRAIELQPGDAETHLNLGKMHVLQGRRDLAVRSFQAAHELSPHDPEITASLLFEMQHLCDWSRFDELCRARRHNISAFPDNGVDVFSLLAIPSTRQEQLAAAGTFARRWRRAVESQGDRWNFPLARRAKPRLRIGYLSVDFRNHVVAHLTSELFELHDRGRFEVYAYSYGPDDGSEMRAQLKRAFDRFVDVSAQPVGEAARAIHRDGIDILVDLTGYTQSFRPEIMALRPAPLQVSYLGYPGTMGAEYVDYLVADSFVTPPGHEGDYSEKLVLMPASYMVRSRGAGISDTPARQALGLPEDAFVYCCFNQSFKILPQVFDAWMRILAATPGAVLWLPEFGSVAIGNLRREASLRRVDPERLVWAPRLPRPEDHLARLRAADLFLDTSPYNAHATANDALWAGLPVLTWAGDTFASRVAGSLLTAIGTPELVTHSLSEYESMALRLARERTELAALRRKLGALRDSSPLFDTPGFARSLEAAFEQMWENYAAGRPPRRIELP